MHKFLREKVFKKVILVIVIAMICNFSIPNFSQAGDGGALLWPIREFIVFLGDTVMSAINAAFLGEYVSVDDARAKGTTSGWEERWDEDGLDALNNEIEWPTILITPEEIFSGKVLLLNVNFLQDISKKKIAELKDDTKVTTDESLRGDVMYGTEGAKTSIGALRSKIAYWYLLIRNLSAAALFCVLIYVGIRIIISSASEERAKYKARLIDWVVAICIVFFLHYIMATIMYATDKTVEILREGLTNSNTGYKITQPGNDNEENFEITKSAVPGLLFNGGKEDSGTAKIHNLVEYARLYTSAEDRRFFFSDIH